MEASFWHERWASNQIGWHEREVNPLLRTHFHALALPAGSRVFVPLCGKTRDIAWLLQQGCGVAGCELNEMAVQQLFAELEVEPVVTSVGGMTRYSATALDIFVGDVFALAGAQLGPVAAIYDRAALVALPPAMRERYAAHLQTLTAVAPQLLVTFEYDQNAVPGPPHAVLAAELWRHYGANYQLALLDVHTVPGGLKGLAAADEMVWLLRPR
ncbi:MAG: hypothetical protein RLZZ227_43 [Pseudomonadota bacterium]